MIEYRNDDGVAVITLNAPKKLNALGLGDLAALEAAYAQAEDDGVRALILRGEGRAFCAGRDIAVVNPAEDDIPGYLDGALRPLMRRMSEFPAPTFAAAQGAVLGVGLGLLIATDVVYVAETAKFGSPFGKLGATLDSGGHALFVDRLGAHRALDLIYSGEMISGAEAVRAGLFSRAFTLEELDARVCDAAAAAANGATQSFLASKAIVRRVRDERLGLWESIDEESRAQTALAATDDYREGFAAFNEKRTPVFTGRG